MAFPAFFNEVPPLRVRDRLCQLLGASSNGIIEYHYSDAVRLAGHSCPTVAGAWLVTRAGLAALYPNAVPDRGNISVFLPGAENEGVTGVIGQVLTLVTGAAAANGFHGLGAQHRRSGLLHYHASGENIRMQRNDTKAAVEIRYDPSSIPSSPALRPLMQAVMQDAADNQQKLQFGQVWQDRVRRLLLEHADDDDVVNVQPLA